MPRLATLPTTHRVRERPSGVVGNEDQPRDWTGHRVTVMGLGRHGGGVGAARYLATRGANVTISDLADRDSLADSLAHLRELPIAAVHLGGHQEADFRSADLVVVNPAVRPDHPALRLARDSGAVLSSEIELFLRACRAQVIGVTGSNGKSTTCSMLAAMLRAAGFRTWLGGNIGGSLLDDVDRIEVRDRVVLELSSFQLAHLSDDAPLPSIGVVTSFSPNHLDWHGSLAEYRLAKLRLIARQAAGSWAVLPDDAELAEWAALGPGRKCRPWPLASLPPLPVAGEHNLRNAACAASAAELAGASRAAIHQALAGFRGLPHRMEFVAEVAGRKFYNDSKSTTPEATIAALEALAAAPIWLLAGGQPKGAPFDRLAGAVVARSRGAALFGAARDRISAAIRERSPAFDMIATEHLADALDWCWRRSAPGDVILLSPACASLDQFADFAVHGAEFAHLAHELAARDESSASE